MSSDDFAEGAAITRRGLLRWASWFAIINGLIMALIGLRYLGHYPLPDEGLARLYSLIAYLGHFAFLAYLPFLLILLPLALLIPKRGLITAIAVVTASCGITLLLLDTLVFAENRFHLNTLTITILGWKTWGFGILYFVTILIFETLLAKWTWQLFGKPARRRLGIYVAIPLVLFFVSAQFLHIWADAKYYVPITSFTHYLPLFPTPTAKSFLSRHGWVDLKQARERRLVDQLDTHRGQILNYPLSPLDCKGKPEMNVLMIIADALRWDMITTETTPNIARFAERATVFDTHYSGGNSSKMGLFSLFYGLPSTYWGNFESLQRTPVLMEKFQEHDYQLGIFGSAVLYRPVSLDRTAFANVPNLRTETRSSTDRAYERDQIITREWREWLAQRDSTRPFFGFLFYDATTMPDFPSDYQPLFAAVAGASAQQQRLARYKTAVHFVDSLIGGVLQDLVERQLMDNTVVIISADHGEEFDEVGLGYARHGSSYSQYQMRTPMVVYWPGRPAAKVTRRTSHNDVVPTLLTGLFGCRNAVSDYSSGYGLFAGKQWDWLIAGSYHNFAVIEPEQITITYPGGYFEIRDQNYALLKQPQINRAMVTAAIKEMGRFYR
ncbi:MAG: DUF3413 domain-containing protein [Acidiferrobacterales bacterium]